MKLTDESFLHPDSENLSDHYQQLNQVDGIRMDFNAEQYVTDIHQSRMKLSQIDTSALSIDFKGTILVEELAWDEVFALPCIRYWTLSENVNDQGEIELGLKSYIREIDGDSDVWIHNKSSNLCLAEA